MGISDSNTTMPMVQSAFNVSFLSLNALFEPYYWHVSPLIIIQLNVLSYGEVEKSRSSLCSHSLTRGSFYMAFL